MKTQFLPLLELNLATLFISTSGVFGKVITLPASQVIFWRCLISFIFLAVFLWIKKRVNIKELFQFCKFLLFSGLMLGVHWVLYFQAIKVSTVAIAFISVFTFPVITTFLEPILLKQKLEKFNLLSAFLVLIGIYLLVPNFDLDNSVTLGVVLGVTSACFFSVRNILSKKYIKLIPSSAMMVSQMLVITLFLSPIFLFQPLEMSVPNFQNLILLGLVTTSIGQTMFVRSLKHFSTSTSSIISSLQPIYGIFLAFILLGEKPDANIIIGGSIILSTVLLETFKQYFVLSRKTST